MALTQPTYIASADYTYANAYIALKAFKFTEGGSISTVVYIYKDADVASKNPESPMVRVRHGLSLEDFDGDKGSISMATIYAKLKELYYPEADNC